MSEENKAVELKDEELEKVTGGDVTSANVVGYNDIATNIKQPDDNEIHGILPTGDNNSFKCKCGAEFLTQQELTEHVNNYKQNLNKFFMYIMK